MHNNKDQRRTYMIIVLWHRLIQPDLYLAQHRCKDGSQLQVCELGKEQLSQHSAMRIVTYQLADTTVSASAERLVRTICTLAHGTESIVDLLAVVIQI